MRTEENWKFLDSQLEAWGTDQASKTLLEKDFSYESAMWALTHKDFDRALFFAEREASEFVSQWSNLNKLSEFAKHHLVQRIQRVYEMKEFISLVKS